MINRSCALIAVAFVALNCAEWPHAEAAPTDTRLLEAQKSFDEGKQLHDAGQYAEALPRVERARELREAVLGSAHPEVAKCLHLLGLVHRRLGSYAQAEQFLQRALAIREAALGKDHPEVASSLLSLANLSLNQGHHAGAEELYQRAIAIQEATLGENHPDLAKSLNNLANVYLEQGHYARAEVLYQRALEMREAVLEKNHPEIAQSLGSLANVYSAQGDYRRAEPLYQRSLAIQEAALGGDHPYVAIALNNLARLYSDQGHYARAEEMYQRALAIQKKAIGANHPQVAQSLNNLAVIYDARGRYAEAEERYRRALTIWEATLGKEHPNLAQPLNNLATLYAKQGAYELAEPLLRRGLEISKTAFGKNHTDVALALHNLAGLNLSQKRYAQAEPLIERALAIREATLGKNDPLVATSLHNLAYLDEAQGNHAGAERRYRRALAIQEAAFGKNHPILAPSLHKLADLDSRRGRYARAEALYERALAIQEATLGKNHPEVAESLNKLAQLRLARQQLSAALPLLERGLILSEEHLRQQVFGFSEERLARFLHLLHADEERLYALVRSHPDDANVRHLALSTALLRKGRSVEEIANTSRIVNHGLGKAERETFERLRALHTQFAALAWADSDTLASPGYQQRLKDLSDQSAALEADLARRSGPLRAFLALPPPAEVVKRVASALPRDGALVEFVAYHDDSFVPKPGAAVSQTPSEPRYLALLLFADGQTRALDLGPAAPIDRAVLRLNKELGGRSVSYLPAARALHARAFRPLVPLLGKARRLFLSPDGQLALVPFAALHDGRQFLVDDFDITYLTSGKDLLPQATGIAPSQSVIVLADPDFSAAPAKDSPSELVDDTWVPLPGTREEAEAIHRLLPQARILAGRAATKEALLKLATPGILHIATHGFFAEDADSRVGTRAPFNFGAVGDAGPLRHLPSPLLRSGLVLAGAGASAMQLGTSHDMSSLVTALELSGLDLWGTQLVVLSACDTGRGEVKLGQGVYGLRRALVVAGAQTLVTSLWKVDDETTHLLMESYYHNLLAGQGRATALRSAMKTLRQKKPHPYFWAPFIALGQDAPLQGLLQQEEAAATTGR